MPSRSGAELRDLLLPAAVIGVVGMMVFPLPLWMLDVLLMCNIAFALSLLLAAVYLSEPERFTSLPTILLLATLFRLGLNISTTRQILAAGEAPATVSTFGSFVVQGNLVVGLVVFLIITLVQFLVVAKGAERVAEVAARFTLDGMPGKQMSIDADVRAGILSLTEAREKRIALQRESRLYGSLDGAMKFVKGDAIAGLLITGVNISAGLLLGMTQHGLSLSDAVQRFTLFTIGDGLVSQIPALLVAVSAGIAVTRVNNEQGTLLGRDMIAQLTEEPQAVAATAVVLALLGAIPGLPGAAFWLAALVLLCAAAVFKQQHAEEAKRIAQNEFRPTLLSGFLLSLIPAAAAQLQQEGELPDMVFALRRSFFDSTGLLIPDIQFEIVEGEERPAADLLYHGVSVFQLSQDELKEQNTGEVSRRLRDGIERFALENRVELIDDSQTRLLLEVHRPACEDLIHSTVPELISVTALTTVLRELAAEDISVRALHRILQAVAEHHCTEKEGGALGARAGAAALPALHELSEEGSAAAGAGDLLSNVRVALSPLIVQRVSGGSGRVSAVVAAVELDRLLAQSAAAGAVLEPSLAERFAMQVQEELREAEHPVVVCSRYARRAASHILRSSGVAIPVVAADELRDNVELELLSEIG